MASSGHKQDRGGHAASAADKVSVRRVAVIGAGAAGCFCAAELAALRPDLKITVYEAGRKPLAKVAVTGGGRCNLTNSFAGISDMSRAYPRGHRLMSRLFRQFGPEDTWKWFEDAGVALVLQEDQCVFPESQDAMQIVRTLLGKLRSGGVTLRTGCRLTGLSPGWKMDFADGSSAKADAVVIATGGSPKRSGLAFLDSLGIETAAPVPSLYTFKIDGPVRNLAGTVVKKASCILAGTRVRSSGPLLITDWGMSGPAILKLSSYNARSLAENGFKGTLIVNWSDEMTDTEAREMIRGLLRGNEKKLLSSVRPEFLTNRLWEHLLVRAGLRNDLRAGELGGKGLNRLVDVLTADSYEIVGRAGFKEEFVTCGGVSLSEIDFNTMEAKRFPGLYFAGEVLDEDAITGGFNLQAAWTTGYVAAHAIARQAVTADLPGS